MTDLETAPTEREELVSKFLEETGYGMSDVLGLSYLDKLFLMKNGGKYRVTEDGIEHIKGPSPDPSERI